MDSFFRTLKLSPYATNSVQSREDLTLFLTQLLDALEPHTSLGGSRIHLGFTGTHFDEVAAHLEGFSRPLWGLSSLLAGGQSYEGIDRWIHGLANGTDPDHEEYWGPMRDKDQRMVECSALGFTLSVAGDQFWNKFSEREKDNIANWLGGMNDKEMPNTNWLWFRVFANLGLSKVGHPRADIKRMKADMDHLDTFFIGDGWSRDGPEGVVQLDYYSSSFAIQFAQMAYSKLASEEDPQRCAEFRGRAQKFALDFVHYFDEEGRAIPFGRSLTYRFAMSSFWGALAYADIDLPAPLTWGIVKGLLLRNIRWWAQQAGAYNTDGTFTIGYAYPNHHITENYNSPGSPYWACKAFVVLALPPSHPFWTSEEEAYPFSSIPSTKVLKHPLHLATSLGGHHYILSSGQQCSYAVKQGASKYGKFAYSSAFGYSVSIGGYETLAEVAADNMLALSDDNEVWKVRRDTREARFEAMEGVEGGMVLRSMWYPWPDVQVETFLIPPNKDTSPLWHLRAHRVRSSRKLHTAEGGWVIHGQGPDSRALALTPDPNSEAFGTYESASEARAASKKGVVGVVSLLETKGLKAIALRTDANTNLMEPRAVMPTILCEHPGDEEDLWLVIGVFGLPSKGLKEGADDGWLEEWNRRPEIPKSLGTMIG